MVHAHHIVPLAGSSQALEPPLEAVGLHPLPVIDWVTPELTVSGEGIGRTAGNDLGGQILIQLEHLGLCPDLHGIQRHVDGHVTDDLDAVAVGIGAQSGPLLVEQVLDKAVEPDLVCQLIAHCLHGLGIAHLHAGLPVVPGGAVILGLQGHEHGEIGQPGLVVLQEQFKLIAALETGVGNAQNLQLVIVELAEIGLGIAPAPVDGLHLFLIEQALFDQGFQIDQIVVAGEGGAGLVGRVTVAGGSQGQNLPHGLACRLQKIYEREGLLAHGAHTIGAGEAGNMHQNTAASHRNNLLYFIVGNLPGGCFHAAETFVLFGKSYISPVLKRFQQVLTLTEYYFFIHLSSENRRIGIRRQHFWHFVWILSGFFPNYSHFLHRKIQKTGPRYAGPSGDLN